MQFKDITFTANITHIGRTWGAAWGDFNNDNFPDLYVGNHQNPPSLFLNQKDGTFIDVAVQVLGIQSPTNPPDNHGASWADFDNDGDLDLIQVAGGALGNGTGNNSRFFNQLYVNEAGKFKDLASEFEVTYPKGRGRTVQWFDIDKDGWLDLVLPVAPQNDGSGPTTILRQDGNTFDNIRELTELSVESSPLSFATNLLGNDDFELIFSVNAQSGLVVNTFTQNSFIDLTSSILPDEGISTFLDVAAADFNGDLKTDLFLTRTKRKGFSSLKIDESGRILARLVLFQRELGFEFKATGPLTFDLFLRPRLSQENIYIGANALAAEDFFEFNSTTPNGLNQAEWQLKVSPQDTRLVGLPSSTFRDQQEGIYIGYEPTTQTWTLLLSGENEGLSTVISQDSGAPLSDIARIGFLNATFSPDNQLLLNSNEGLIDQSEVSGINAGVNDNTASGQSIVSGDFDNDMDLDVYVVNSGRIANAPNTLFENQGNGIFIPVVDAGGASGSNQGLGDVVVSADYDLDGFLDLFITNGNWPPPFTNEGPDQLFQNLGNDNHWLEIDLEGVISNRDGIGATVYVTAGGVIQVREQAGGVHLYAQNHPRLHFGLANHTVVDEILVRWPNGEEQRILDIPADQLIRIVEDSGNILTKGKPEIDGGLTSQVLLWKETFDGPYHLRTTGSLEDDSVNFAVELLSNSNLLDVKAIELDSGDILTESSFGFSLESNNSGSQEGVDFYLSPGATALLSITEDGIANPRQIIVGEAQNRLTPTGWILDSEDFPTRPSFTTGRDLGLFIGKGETSETLEFRWSGDGNPHLINLDVLGSEPTATFSPISLTQEDIVIPQDNGINIESSITEGFKGIDVTISTPIKLGFRYEQDNLNQIHRVNNYDPLLGFQNAYQLPVAHPYGKPIYAPETEEGLFLWKDQVNDIWHLRGTAGGKFRRYQGSIIADQTIESVTGISIESNDVIDTVNPLQINFDLRMAKIWEDGIDFRIPTGATVSLNLQKPSNNPATLVKIGEQKWEVSALPLDLSGWDTPI